MNPIFRTSSKSQLFADWTLSGSGLQPNEAPFQIGIPADPIVAACGGHGKVGKGRRLRHIAQVGDAAQVQS